MNPAESDDVLLHHDNGIATVTLNRPAAMNTINIAMATAFSNICEAIAADPRVRAVVVQGAGHAFGGGGDLTVLRNDAVSTVAVLIDRIHRGIDLLTKINAPVIASLHGAVAGASMSLAMACDFSIAAEGTKFNLSYAKVAASCDCGGSWHLPRLVGLRNAMQIALLSETFDADEALRLGLVNRVVSPNILGAETFAMARRLADGPTLAYGRIKRLLRQSFDTSLAAQLDAERDEFQSSVVTNDFKEAATAFFEKRPPIFKGN